LGYLTGQVAPVEHRKRESSASECGFLFAAVFAGWRGDQSGIYGDRVFDSTIVATSV
jgi:hypothetical protein